MSGIRTRQIKIERLRHEIDLQRVEMGVRVGGTLPKVQRWIDWAHLARIGVKVARPLFRRNSRRSRPGGRSSTRRRIWTNPLLPLTLAFCVGWLATGRKKETENDQNNAP